jgi:membrane-bound lytic murein transglycosylase B
MTWRTGLGLATTAFLLLGVIGWIAGMPRPAETVSAYLPAVGGDSAAVAQSIDDPDPAVPSATDGVVAAEWLKTTSQATRIPIRALQAYAAAAITEAQDDPGCGLSWNTIAAIGSAESGHGTHHGAHIDGSGQLVGSILGPVLDGKQFDAVPDSDKGALDGDEQWDRAVGPLQFLPGTWKAYGADGNGDGKSDPNQIDDAALGAARYLCASGGDLATDKGWTAAIRAYNPNADYVNAVAAQAGSYAEAVE